MPNYNPGIRTVMGGGKWQQNSDKAIGAANVDVRRLRDLN
jgi:hypothetical protein